MNKIIIVLLLFLTSCTKPELQYFKNMSEYPDFDNIVEDKTVLRGIDKTRITQNRRGEYFLSTPNDALFNIEGQLFFKDSVVYIKTHNSETGDTLQILFNFRQAQNMEKLYYPDSTPYFRSLPYDVYYKRNDISYCLHVQKYVNINTLYLESIDDYLTDFMIRKEEDNFDAGTFHLHMSLKCGIVYLIRWNANYMYHIDIPNREVIKSESPLKDIDYHTL